MVHLRPVASWTGNEDGDESVLVLYDTGISLDMAMLMGLRTGDVRSVVGGLESWGRCVGFK